MDLFLFFVGQFKVPIMGLTILVLVFWFRFYVMPRRVMLQRVERVEQPDQPNQETGSE